MPSTICSRGSCADSANAPPRAPSEFLLPPVQCGENRALAPSRPRARRRRAPAALGRRHALLASFASTNGARGSRRCARWACVSSTRTCPGASTSWPRASSTSAKPNPRLDVVRFLELAHELGLRCVLRPGPHINAELTFFGLPERVVWDPECQARTPGGHPVMLPILPVAFPVPSYASDAFLEETARLVPRRRRALSRLRWPDGPIVLVQVDNEGALYFRDGSLRSGLPPRRATRVPRVPPHEVPSRTGAPQRLGRRDADLRDGRAAAPIRRQRAPRSRPPRRLDRVSRAAPVERDGSHGRRPRRRWFRRDCRRRTICRSARARRR